MPHARLTSHRRSKRVRRRTPWAGAVLLLLSGALHAKKFYVDANGGDQSAGTLEQPFRTLERAVAAVQPGDAIEVRAGTYTGVTISRPGAGNGWITLRPHGDERVRITAARRGAPTLYFYHRSCDEDNEKNYPCQPLYWVVDGFEITGSGAGGGNVIKIDTPKVKIVRNNLSGSSADIIKLVRTADDVEILHNEIHHPNARAGANAQGVDIVGADRTRVAHNYVHDIPSIGMYAKGNARDTVFEHNRVENTYSHGIMLGQSTDAERLGDGRYESYDGIVRNNIIRHTGWSCFATASSYNVRIYNNSCYQTGAQVHGAVLISNESEVRQPGTRIDIRNNIIHVSGNRPAIKITSNALTDGATLTVDHNLYWSSSGAHAVTFSWRDKGLEEVAFGRWRGVTRQDEHSQIADPQYADSSTLQLAPSSPAIKAGTVSELVAVDYRGVPRSCQGRTSIGAYEPCASRQ